MKLEKGITLVSLVVTIIILVILAGISFSVTIGEDGILTKAKQAKQNIMLAGEAEAMQLNQLYYELETGGEMSEDEESTKKDEIIALLQKQVEELKKQVISLQTENAELKKQIEDLNVQISNLQKEIADLKAQIASKDIEIAALKKQVSEKEAKIQELQNQLNNLNSLLAQTNATADKILAGYKAYSGGKLITGTMKNNGSINKTLNVGESLTIPEGYTAGGKISVNTPENQKALEIQIPVMVSTGATNYGYSGWVNYTHKKGINVQVIKTGGSDSGKFGNIVIADDILVDITNQLVEGETYKIFVNSNAETRYTRMTIKLSFEKNTGFVIELPMQATTGYTNKAYDAWLDYIHMDGIKVEVKKTGGNANGKFGNIVVSNTEYKDITNQLISGTRYTCKEASGNNTKYVDMTIRLSF